MKFQDYSFNGLKVTVGTKSVTHPRTHAPKAICPINFFKVGGIIMFSRWGQKEEKPLEHRMSEFTPDVETSKITPISSLQIH